MPPAAAGPSKVWNHSVGPVANRTFRASVVAEGPALDAEAPLLRGPDAQAPVLGAAAPLLRGP